MIRLLLAALLIALPAGAVQNGAGSVSTVYGTGAGSVSTVHGTGAGSVSTAYVANTEVSFANLAAYYPMEEGTGYTTTRDYAGSRYAVLTNGPTWTTGKTGNAIQFVGASSQYLAIGNPPVVGDSTAYSIALWFKTTSTTVGKLYDEGSTASANQSLYISANENAAGDVEFGLQDNASTWGGFSPSPAAYNDGNWHHVVFVQISKSSRKFYIDGNLAGTNTTTVGTCTFNLASVGVQRKAALIAFFTGTVDQVRIYSRDLTATEVSTLYANGR